MLWTVILGGFVMCLMAFGIGANDSANSWGTSVGSGAIGLRRALLIGGAMEFFGAVTLGYGVSTTIQKGVSQYVWSPEGPSLSCFVLQITDGASQTKASRLIIRSVNWIVHVRLDSIS